MSMLTESTIVGIRHHDDEEQQGGSPGLSSTCVEHSLITSVGGHLALCPTFFSTFHSMPCHAWLCSASASSAYDRCGCCNRCR